MKPIDAIEEMGDQHDDESKECNYEASSRNELNVHQESYHKDGYNENGKLEVELCRQFLECEDCDDKLTLKDDLKDHEEVPHEDVFGSNY